MNRCLKVSGEYMCWRTPRPQPKPINTNCDFREETSTHDTKECKFAVKRDNPPIGRWDFTHFCSNVDAQIDRNMEEL